MSKNLLEVIVLSTLLFGAAESAFANSVRFGSTKNTKFHAEGESSGVLASVSGCEINFSTIAFCPENILSDNLDISSSEILSSRPLL